MKPFPSSPPPPLQPKPWNFPKQVVRQVTPGVDVVVVRMPALPIVSVRWCFLSAGLFEDAEVVGSAALLQRLLRHGTLDADAKQFARQLDRRGIRLGTQVSADSMIVSVTALREYLRDAIQIANDVAFRPRLPESAMAMERMRVQHTVHQAGAQVESMVGLRLNHAVYGSHPYGRPPTTIAGLKKTTLEDIRSLQQRIVGKTNAMLLVVGDVEPHETAEALAKMVSELPVAHAPEPVQPDPISRPTGGVCLVEHPGAEQVAIGVAALAPPRNHPDFLPLRVVNHILGGGASSRLFARLRNQEALTYGAYSRLDCGRWAGDWTANLTVAPPKLGRAIDLVCAEIQKVALGEIAERQKHHAVQYLSGSFPQRACGLSGVSLLTTAAWMHDLPAGVWRDYQSNLLGMSLEQTKRAASKWIRPKELCWVIAGPPSALTTARAEIAELHPSVEHADMASLMV